MPGSHRTGTRLIVRPSAPDGLHFAPGTTPSSVSSGAGCDVGDVAVG